MNEIIGRTLGGKLIAIATAGLIGAGALGGVAAAATSPSDAAPSAFLHGAAALEAKAGEKAGALKKILDGLVAKGTITQTQEDAILDAIHPKAENGKPSVVGEEHGIRELIEAAEQYLGLTPAALRSQLKAGASLGTVADATAGKSRNGLIDALTADENARIDAAVTAGKLTPDQAAAAKAKALARITKLVDHATPAKPDAKPGAKPDDKPQAKPGKGRG